MTDKEAAGLTVVDDERVEVNPAQIFAPKWYLNGFPKAGTHLLTSMMNAHAKPMPPSQMHPREWMGTFRHHAWTNEWGDMQRLKYEFGHILPGYYFKGHCGHTKGLERYLEDLGVAFVFIYRDLRDVAVSQAHHIFDEGQDNWKHDNKAAYRELGFDGTLSAVITGKEMNGVWYPGVVKRWETYAPWLDVDWVYSFSYREGRLEPERVASEIITYGLRRLATIYNLRLEKPGEGFPLMVTDMAEASRDTEHSNTFRRGVVGGWRDEFTEEHVEQFKEHDRADWLVRLGFEEDNDWSLENGKHE